MRPTPEQEQVLALAATGQDIAIVAGAGAGKSTTLRMVAERVGKPCQYIAFNKALADEAASKMPRNCSSSTAHSLAFREVGVRYSHRLGGPRMRSIDVSRQLGLRPIMVRNDLGTKVLQPGYLAGVVKRGVDMFCQSTDEVPLARHMPYIQGIDLPGEGGVRTYANNRIVAEQLEPAMRRYWMDVNDPDGKLRFTHGHYFKMWAMDDPRIPADVILVDEAQDLSPVLRQVVEVQGHAQKIWVGDPFQEIYAWAGAINAIEHIEAANRAYLTLSFRFGSEIADLANEILGRLSAEFQIRGNPAVDSVVCPVDDPDVVLCRTNAYAMGQFFDALTQGRTPYLVGGGAEIIEFARGAKALKEQGFTAHPELACFTSWFEVQSFVDQDEDGNELRQLVKLVDRYGADTIINVLGQMPAETDADVVISTAHKAKGRQWSVVQLGQDFPEASEDDADLPAEELRLLYVAVTRAQHCVDIEGVAALTGAGVERPVLALEDLQD